MLLPPPPGARPATLIFFFWDYLKRSGDNGSWQRNGCWSRAELDEFEKVRAHHSLLPRPVASVPPSFLRFPCKGDPCGSRLSSRQRLRTRNGVPVRRRAPSRSLLSGSLSIVPSIACTGQNGGADRDPTLRDAARGDDRFGNPGWNHLNKTMRCLSLSLALRDNSYIVADPS